MQSSDKNGIPRLKPAAESSLQRAREARELIRASWLRNNPGATECPWQHVEECALSDLLAEVRRAQLDIATLIRHRELTPGVRHQRRPCKWMRELVDFRKPPVQKEAIPGAISRAHDPAS
jgi:hypothetical protein